MHLQSLRDPTWKAYLCSWERQVDCGKRALPRFWEDTYKGFASRIGALQEYGTVKMPAQPFMRPAFAQEKGFAVQAIRETLKKRIDKANNGGGK